jgi:hypothetical protein
MDSTKRYYDAFMGVHPKTVDIREIGSIFVKDTFYILCVSLRV